MNRTPALLTAANRITLEQRHAPEWILYLPAGQQFISASLNGKPAQIEVIVNAAAAERLHSDLQARRASSVLPTLDFDHEGKKASAWPSAFRWVEGRGVEIQAGWNASGKAAVETGDYNYFSPQFAYDKTSKEVVGLLATGPIGGLVNDPAFRALGAILARHEATQPTTTTTDIEMKHTEIVNMIVAAGILTEAEASTDNAPALVQARLAAQKVQAAAAPKTTATEDSPEVADLKAQLTKVRTEAADTAVADAVKAGRIAAGDEPTKAWWKKQIIAGDEGAVKALNVANVVVTVPGDTGLPSTVQASAAGEEKPLTDAQAASVQARSSELVRTQRMPHSQAWSQAEAEVRGKQG